jgi:hypothetical protein
MTLPGAVATQPGAFGSCEAVARRFNSLEQTPSLSRFSPKHTAATNTGPDDAGATAGGFSIRSVSSDQVASRSSRDLLCQVGWRKSLAQIKSPLSKVRADRNFLEGIAGNNRIAPHLTELNIRVDVIHLSAVAVIE